MYTRGASSPGLLPFVDESAVLMGVLMWRVTNYYDWGGIASPSTE